MKRKESAADLFSEVKELLSGATLRAIIGLEDIGEIFLTIASSSTIQDAKRYIWTDFKDALSGLSGVGKLFVPGGIVFRLPGKNEVLLAVRGRKQHGPGGPIMMPLGGDGQTDNTVPDWLDKDNAGISGTETMHMESTKGDVKVDAPDNGKQVLLQGNDFSALKTEDLLTTLNKLCTDLLAGTAGGPTKQSLVSTTGVVELQTKIADGSYKSTLVKHG